MNISGVGEMGVGETGVGEMGQIIGETGVGKMGVGETGTSQNLIVYMAQYTRKGRILCLKQSTDVSI